MIEAPVLENELDRLNDLYSLNLLDSFKEERFDRLIRLVKKTLGVEIAYLALVDKNRQWLKSKCGISIDESGRSTSFCGHTIAQQGLMVVPDATRDERFFDNPMVVDEPRIRFYAGYPLQGPGGSNVGTFCMASTQPRDLTEDEKSLFIDFAKMAQRELKLYDVIASQNQLLETQLELEKVRQNMQRELQEAAGFVLQKLPKRFEDNRLKLDWDFIASSQLGGDMFGLEPIDGERYLFYLLDVSGHGIGASLLAVTAQNTIRQFIADANTKTAPSPAELLRHLNANFQMVSNQNKFFTMWCGLVDLSSRTVCYSNAGHPAPVLLNAELKSQAIGQDSMMIGITPNAKYEDHQCSFARGSRIVLFSDGILEELNSDNEQFGRQRLEQAYSVRCSTGNCGLNSIVDKVRSWNGNKPFADDVSLVELTLK